MGDTIKEFFMFISDNPLMLALCGAIVLLFIILLIVLFAGGKKEKPKKDVKLENTSELFTAPIDNENLKNTKETNVQTVQNVSTLSSVEKKPTQPIEENNINLEETLDLEYNEEEAPININDALNLKKEREIVPNIENTTSTPKQLDETDIIPIPVELNKTSSNKLNISIDDGEKPLVFKGTKDEKIPEIKDFFTTQKKDTPVIPDSINDESQAIDETINKLINEVNLIKTGQIEVGSNYRKIDEMMDEVSLVKTKSLSLDPLSNAEISYKIESLINDLNSFKTADNPTEIELPKQTESVNEKNNNNTFDKISNFKSSNNISTPKKAPNLVADDDLDDIELPMLKTEDTSPLKVLKGESFNLD